jgi:hypothetical protein
MSIDGHLRLGVGPSNAPAQPKIIQGFKIADLRTVAWVNNDRLVFTITSAVEANKAWEFYLPGNVAGGAAASVPSARLAGMINTAARRIGPRPAPRPGLPINT